MSRGARRQIAPSLCFSPRPPTDVSYRLLRGKNSNAYERLFEGRLHVRLNVGNPEFHVKAVANWPQWEAETLLFERRATQLPRRYSAQSAPQPETLSDLPAYIVNGHGTDPRRHSHQMAHRPRSGHR